MKKFTALMLVVLMLIVSIPFSVFAKNEYVVINNAQELANIKDGKYWLAADIDLSAAAWTKIADFSGILDGNGHTITVPSNTVLFDTITGTVKNVNLVSASQVLLENDDNSTFKTPEASVNEAGVGIGVLANVAKGATIENVHTNVNVRYYQSSGRGAHVGALVGIALADYAVEDNKLIINRETVIKNCSTDGYFDVDWRWDNSMTDPLFKNGFGGIVGYAYGNVVIENTRSSVDYDFYKNRARSGGIVGQCRSLSYGETYTNYKDVIKPVEITNCLVDGDFNGMSVASNSNQNPDVIGGITGYNVGAILTNCVFAGNLKNDKNSQVRHIFGYSNVGNASYAKTVVQGCISVGTASKAGNDVNEVIYGKGHGIFALNNYLVAGQTIVMEASSVTPNLETQNVGNTTYDDATAAMVAFVAANSENFKLVNGEITLIQPEFTPKVAAPEYVTLYEDSGKNYVTTGKAVEYDDYNDAEFAGFVQFNANNDKARFVMAIDSDYLEEASAQYESFDVVITVNGDKVAVVNSRSLSTYTEVNAEEDVYYADNCEIFGFIMSFRETVVETLSFKIVIGETTFELGSYTAN